MQKILTKNEKYLVILLLVLYNTAIITRKAKRVKINIGGNYYA